MALVDIDWNRVREAVAQGLLAALGEFAPAVAARIYEKMDAANSPFARELTPYKIDGNTTDSRTALYSDDHGLVALKALLDDIHTDLDTRIDALYDQIGSPVQVDTAPPWYTAPTTPDFSGLPAAFLAATFPVDQWCMMDPDISVADALRNVYQNSIQQSWGNGTRWPRKPEFTLYGCSPDEFFQIIHAQSPDTVFFPPDVDWSALGSADLVTFLNSVDPDAAWSYGAGSSTLGAVAMKRAAIISGVTLGYWRIDLPLIPVYQTVENISSTVTHLPTPTLPPVLSPTVYTRSYQSEISFTEPFVHNVPCDGLVYTIGTHGQRVKAFDVGDYSVLTGAGVVLFTDENGAPEPYQFINADRGVILPKAMTHASGFIWSSNVALSGTVTPFTLVPVT